MASSSTGYSFQSEAACPPAGSCPVCRRELNFTVSKRYLIVYQLIYLTHAQRLASHAGIWCRFNLRTLGRCCQCSKTNAPKQLNGQCLCPSRAHRPHTTSTSEETGVACDHAGRVGGARRPARDCCWRRSSAGEELWRGSIGVSAITSQ